MDNGSPQDEQHALESSHLMGTIERLQFAIVEMEKSKKIIEASRKEQNRYLKDEMGSAPGDFLQAVEFSQTLQAEKQLLEQRGYEDHRKERYERLLLKPYFGRLDYCESGINVTETLYIGYGNFMDSKSLEIFIYYWRTPIASIFYDFQTGPVHYKAPDGTINGQVNLKRQYDIQKAKLIAYYDTNLHVADDRLLTALASRTAGPMHQIVETLQAEQNRIIREKRAVALFVEGVAGSGKTIIALHRIAYLLYHGLKNSLKSQQIVVLSPNDLFSNYIGHVLPELGEEHVHTMTLGDLFEGIMGREIAFESSHKRLEDSLNGELPTLVDLSMTVKSDLKILDVLREALVDFEKKGVACSDFYYGSEKISAKATMKKALKGDGRYRPPMKRLERFFERVRHKVKDIERRHYAEILIEVMLSGDHPFDYKAVARLERFKRYKALSDQLNGIMAIDGTTIYRWLMENPKYFKQHFPECSSKQIVEMAQQTLKRLDSGLLGTEDWLLICWYQMALYGEHSLQGMRQVVIDESQDYSTVAFAVFQKLFPKAHFTILGDTKQRLTSVYEKEHHQRAAEAMQVQDPVFAKLNVAYRNVEGIGLFCQKLFNDPDGFQVVPRAGDAPKRFFGPDSLESSLSWMLEKEHQTIAIVTRTMKRAIEIKENLDQLGQKAVLVDESTIVLPQGILVLPVYFAKGMEFDGVIIADADDATYRDARDRQLLYVAASRGLHHLALLSEEEGEFEWLTA